MNNKRAMEIRDVLRSLALIERSYVCNRDGDPILQAGALRRESALLDAANEIGRLRAALKPFAVGAEALVGYRGEQPDRLVQMGITAADCQRAAEVLK